MGAREEERREGERERERSEKLGGKTGREKPGRKRRKGARRKGGEKEEKKKKKERELFLSLHNPTCVSPRVSMATLRYSNGLGVCAGWRSPLSHARRGHLL